MSLNQKIITVDLDWAPDFMIDKMREFLCKNKVKATWFITHQSPAVHRLKQHPDLFELGIHPNFLPQSTHGSTMEEVIKHCLEIVPDAVSMRSHAMYMSGPLLSYLSHHTSLKIDATVDLLKMPHISPVKHYIDGECMIRLPTFWADSGEIAVSKPQWKLDSYSSIKGLKIFAFHPVHVYFNTLKVEDYHFIKKNHDIQKCDENILSKYINPKKGAGHIFTELVKSLRKKSMTLKELVSDFL